MKKGLSDALKPFIVVSAGIEPATQGFSVLCSISLNTYKSTI
jgi:hypothetical protein